MKAAISLASLFACAFSLHAQIKTTLNSVPDGPTEIRIRNDAAIPLVAFALRVNLANGAAGGPLTGNGAPLTTFVDSAIDPAEPPLLPNHERVVEFQRTVPTGKHLNGKLVYGFPVYAEPVITAAIFADGGTTGDAALLDRLMLRRCNMLQAVEVALDTLSDAGRHNVPRDRLIEQFKRMADSARRWYLPPEQRVGSTVYQTIMGMLVNLPEEQAGAPFPPTAFVAEETAMLNRQRVSLLESQPNLADAAFLRR